MKLTGALVTGLVGLSIWLWQWSGALCVSLSVSTLITMIEKGRTDMLGCLFLFWEGICDGFTLCILTFHSLDLSTSEHG